MKPLKMIGLALAIAGSVFLLMFFNKAVFREVKLLFFNSRKADTALDRGTITKMKDISSSDTYVVYINWDGFAWYYYKLANKDNNSRTPVINGLMKEGVLFENAYTGIPSITNPMQSAIVSGAWPSVTGNCYRYYDKDKKTVIQFKRENKAETIAEAVVRQNLTAASVHQFILQNRGTTAGDERKPYIQVGDGADYRDRFDAAIKLICGERAGKGKDSIKLSHIPSFIAIYMDDLDGIGHNNAISTYGVRRAASEENRLDNILARLEDMDRELGRFVQACKDRGIYQNMAFVLTSDHGMAPYGQQVPSGDSYGCSKLPELIDSLEHMGYKVEFLGEGKSPKEDTDIVLVSAGLQVQLSFAKEKDEEFVREKTDKIIEALKHHEYIGQIAKKDELIERGAAEGFADLLISPKVPYCFKNDSRLHTAGGQHDSLDETAQHIFSLMWGKGVKQGIVYNERIYNIDFARTMTTLLDIDGPKDATGRILTEILTN